jgi:hypothetical protein
MYGGFKNTFLLGFQSSCDWDSVVRIAMTRMVRGSNPGVGEIFRTHRDRPSGPPSLLYVQ